MEAIITAATVLASYLNVASTNVSGYVYNAECEDNQVARVEVYSQDGDLLTKKLQNRYAYDAQGRLARKEILRRNPLTGEMEPSQLYSYDYDEQGYTLSLSNWDKASSRYVPANEKMVYRIVADNVMAVDTYKREDGSKEYERISGTLIMNAKSDIAAI